MDVAADGAPKELARRRIELIDNLDHNRRSRRNPGRRRGRERDVIVVGGQKHRPGIGRRDLDAQILERCPDLVGIEKIGGCEQAVAASTNAFERKPGRLGLLQKLGDAGARQPYRCGEIFAGMESAIRKLAQERESKRSEHKPTSKSPVVNRTTSGDFVHLHDHPIWCILARRSPFSTVL